MNRMNNSAFSLVELSIVLVILGLLTGGILTGQSLIRAAELRTVAVEVNNTMAAVHMFKGKYFYLPGDMPNATSFWGDNSIHCSDAAIPDGMPGTCNGNGDGVIQQEAAAHSEEAEGFMFWNQLALSDMISGEYTGISGPDHRYDSVIGENTPDLKLPNACMGIDNDNVANTTRFDVNYGHTHIELGSDDVDCDGALLIPEEAWNIDKKTDDGKPARGNIIARFWNNACASASSNTDLDADYNFDNKEVACSLYILNLF